MELARRTGNIVVISQTPELADLVRTAAGSAAVVSYAAGETEAFNKIREVLPDIIILGRLSMTGSVAGLYRRLREGWISHHASLLVVEADPIEGRYRIVEDENGLPETRGHEAGPGVSFPSADSFITGLGERISRTLKSRENQLRNAMLDPNVFCVVWEQIPGPGAFELRQELALENARKAARSGLVSAISITDNPGGNPAIATDVLCAEIQRSGVEPLVHVAFRDRNRNQAESQLFQLAALNINNVLVLTGDYPSNLGFTGQSKPVFDLDSINGLRLIAQMNRGLERDILRKPVRLAPTRFFAGVAFSPFKQMEAELMGQFYKLEKKIAAGADFIITQVGFDARKLHELQLWLNTRGYRIPALASVYVLSHNVARAMHGNNIPGCVVTGKLLNQIAAESESPDKGRQARLDRAAKMFAVAKGMGYKGAYVSGQGLPFESLQYIVERGSELAANWRDLLPEFDYPQERGFYYFRRDPQTGLNSPDPEPRGEKPERPPVFLLSWVLHAAIFEPKSPLFRMMRRLMRLIDSRPLFCRVFHWFERWTKSALYACQDCGDCALFDAGYLCPVSQCPKDQRNGPCGGSYDGWCEVYPGKKQCIWVRAYLRLKGLGREDEIGKYFVPPCNWELHQTSSWVNYFLGRDHSAGLRGIPKE